MTAPMTREELLADLHVMRTRLAEIIIDFGNRGMDAMLKRYADFDELFAECEKELGGVAQTAGHWAIQESVPSDGFECYFLLRDGITVAEICGPQSDQRSRDLSDLVSAANASASGGDAVAWTNEAQLGFLKDPTCADIPMAMWAKHGRAATIPLYAAPQQSPRLEREALIEECAKIAADRAVRLRAKAKAQTSPSKQSYFAQSIEARVIADAILALLSPDTTVVPSTSHPCTQPAPYDPEDWGDPSALPSNHPREVGK